MKRIDETYKWRKPTIIDKDPELIDFLKTNPPTNTPSPYAKPCFGAASSLSPWKKTARLRPANRYLHAERAAFEIGVKLA